MIPALTFSGRKLHLSAGDGRTLCGCEVVRESSATDVDCEVCLLANGGYEPDGDDHPMRRVWDLCEHLDRAYEALL